jgi:hypothetical protein
MTSAGDAVVHNEGGPANSATGSEPSAVDMSNGPLFEAEAEGSCDDIINLIYILS